MSECCPFFGSLGRSKLCRIAKSIAEVILGLIGVFIHFQAALTVKEATELQAVFLANT
jgi:hypothetical protein